MKHFKEAQSGTFSALKTEFHWKGSMQTPRVEKVVVSVGVGKVKDKKRIALIADRLQKITGQRAVARGAKQSIASFKIRKGEVIGYQVTLRGKRMYDFLDRLVHIAFPRTRDFRGIPEKSVDPMGNLTLGIREHTIFPETSDEDLRDTFGLAVTVVTTTRNRSEAVAYLRHLGFPFQKTK